MNSAQAIHLLKPVLMTLALSSSIYGQQDKYLSQDNRPQPQLRLRD
jgi:hypothetical protein